MAYQSLYRKYRPQTFADVTGQSHVIRTLQNALDSGRVAHGYLFTGTRGTAKTTIARLLAKALNCESSDRPVPEPCNQCVPCRSITAGSSIDVIEMDAASHRGVADIEEVRKSVGYGPMELRYKVFIIDEAHQLSSDAKDAFLKTLEEPPQNVVFILATTEPQSIPITIRSRCQQFDFKRGSLVEISSRLRYVLDSEGVRYTPEAVNLVARGAEGSYRDSLSLLEQVLAYSPKSVTAEEVNTVLGTLDTEMLARVTHAVATRDAATAFALAGSLLDAGKEARTLLKTMSAHFRNLLLVAVGGPAVAAELSPDEVTALQAQARAFTPAQMMRAMDILNEAQGETRWNNQHRLLVELAFLKLMTIGDAPDAPLPVAPIVFSVAPKVDVISLPLPPPIVESVGATSSPVAPPAIAYQAPVVETHAEVVSRADEELPASYFADTATEEDGSDLFEDEDTSGLEPATPVLAEEPVAAAPAMTVPAPAFSLYDPADDEPPPLPEPPDDSPGLFDEVEPQFAVVPSPATPSPVAQEQPPSPEPPPAENGYALFGEEEVPKAAPVPLARNRPRRK